MEITNIPRPNALGVATDFDPTLYELAESWPHLRELALSLQGDYVCLETKYGQFQRIKSPMFGTQVFEAPEIDPSIGGKQKKDGNGNVEGTKADRLPVEQALDSLSPILAYDPTFDWELERMSVQGQRQPCPANVSFAGGTRFSVRIIAMNISAGLVEPLYGTICLYHSERKEKLSEDFHFQFLPAEWAGDSTTEDDRAIFSLEAQSPAVCLLVQLEKPATEETSTGIQSNVYSRKDPPTLTEKEAIHLQDWAQMMPFRESFCWITIPMFDSSVTGGVGGFGTPDHSTPGSGNRSGSATPGTPRSSALAPEDASSGAGPDFGGPAVLVDIPHLNRVKDSYTEDQVLDPKRKVHKPVRATMRFEIERLPNEVTVETSGGSSLGGGSGRAPLTPKTPSAEFVRESSLDVSGTDYDSVDYSYSTGGVSLNGVPDYDGFRALNFQAFSRSEPFTRLVHNCFVYPQSMVLPKKYNLFIRVELKSDDSDIQRPAMEAMCPRDGVGPMLRSAFSQVASGTRTPLYHDEFKVRLPALLQPSHHFLFTFFHIDLVLKREPPRPAVVGYAVLPLSMAIQLQKTDLTLPVVRELQPHYMEDEVKRSLAYWDDGRPLFRLRTRICSSVLPLNDRVREFIYEYDRHVLEMNPPGSQLLDAINGLKTVELPTLLQYLYPVLNMLLCMIGNGVETLQVAAFRAFVSITTRVQSETGDTSERHRLLVHYVDYVFDDLGRQQTPVYPGLCNVWRSLARSKAKGYKVGPVYDEGLMSAWVVLEVIAKSMALELAQVPHEGEIARLRLEEEVYQCIWQLFDCMLSEVQERVKKVSSSGGSGGSGGMAINGSSNSTLARRLNTAIAFFCYDLLSVVDPPQVFELVGVYLTKFAGECTPVLHRFKLTFLRILCDHDFYIETPGRVPIEKNYLTTVLLKEIFVSLDHEEASQRTYAARILAFLVCKHEFDSRYQLPELKLYIAQLYYPIVSMIMEEPSVYNSLTLREKRDILVAVATIVRSIDEETLRKSWKQSNQRVKVFFQFMEDGVNLFYSNKHAGAAGSLPGGLPEPSGEEESTGSITPFSAKLSPAANHFLAEASKKDPKTVLEREYMMRKMTNASVSGKGSFRDSSSQSGSTARPSMERIRSHRDSLPASLKAKMEHWESSLTSLFALSALRNLDQFSAALLDGSLTPDLPKAEALAPLLTSLLRRNQPISFWEAFPSVWARVLRANGRGLLGPSAASKDRFVKDIIFHIMRRLVYRSEFLRSRAVLCLFLVLHTCLACFGITHRLKAMLTVTISELIADVKLLVKGRDGRLQEATELLRLRASIDSLGAKEDCRAMMAECGIDDSDFFGEEEEEEEEKGGEGGGGGEEEQEENGGKGGEGGGRKKKERKSAGSGGSKWRWRDMLDLQLGLRKVLEASADHARLLEGVINSGDKYAVVESYHGLSAAYAHVPDLHIVWLLHICEAHQESTAWAEAAQCAVAVAGVVMQALFVNKQSVWSREHLEALRRVQSKTPEGSKLLPSVQGGKKGAGGEAGGGQEGEEEEDEEEDDAAMEGYGGTNLTMDSAVKYLQMGNNFFKKAQLHHFCAELLELMLPVHKSRHAYAQLARCHQALHSTYELILAQESSPIPFKDAVYYRVAFYGHRFGKLDRKTYIYREARDVRLGDIVQKLTKLYEAKGGKAGGEEPLSVIPDSRQVDPDTLKPGFCHIQITAVEPVVGSEEERWMGRAPQPLQAGAPSFSCFLFDTPFTQSGKTQGGLEDQWKKRTLLYTDGTFPSVVPRLPVGRFASRDYSPAENAVAVIESRTLALHSELEMQAKGATTRANGGDSAGPDLQLPRLQTLQRLLQGSVALQVNSGVLGVCVAFLKQVEKGPPQAKDPAKLADDRREELVKAIKAFVDVCRRAVAVHARATSDEDQDFHDQMVEGLEALQEEISRFIPGL